MIQLGLLFSIGITPVLFYGFELIGKPVSMIFYALCIYVVQKQLNMKAIRPVIKTIIQKKIDKL